MSIGLRSNHDNPLHLTPPHALPHPATPGRATPSGDRLQLPQPRRPAHTADSTAARSRNALWLLALTPGIARPLACRRGHVTLHGTASSWTIASDMAADIRRYRTRLAAVAAIAALASAVRHAAVWLVAAAEE